MLAYQYTRHPPCFVGMDLYVNRSHNNHGYLCVGYPYRYIRHPQVSIHHLPKRVLEGDTSLV